MLLRGTFVRVVFAFAVASGCSTTSKATACVWKISAPNGGTVFLGGSWHALRSSDYPLPGAYDFAYRASSRLALEVDPRAMQIADKSLVKLGEYPSGDSLKNHVDPRTYDYIRRFFGVLNVPEQRITKYRPWFLSLMLQAPNLHGLSFNFGIDGFFTKRAQADSKRISGLESAREHAEVFSGLTDRQSEALLLLTFVPADPGSPNFQGMLNAWRRGDAEVLSRVSHQIFRDFPSLSERIFANRNRRWIPEIETYLRSGQSYFVIVGAAHMGGSDGLLNLLQGRGYKIEQL
jgi:uncharacterized protein YbaP (TraB family)